MVEDIPGHRNAAVAQGSKALPCLLATGFVKHMRENAAPCPECAGLHRNSNDKFLDSIHVEIGKCRALDTGW